jgi:hypothetical protein
LTIKNSSEELIPNQKVLECFDQANELVLSLPVMLDTGRLLVD